MKRLYIKLFTTFVSTCIAQYAFAQSNDIYELYKTLYGEKVARYHELIYLAQVSPRPIEATKQLIAETNRVFTPKNLEYFVAYSLAGGVRNALIDPRQALRYNEIAFETHRVNSVNYPDDGGVRHVGCLVNFYYSYMNFGINSTPIQIMESQENQIAKYSNLAKCTFYNQLSRLYLNVGRYDKAGRTANIVRKILESDEPLISKKKAKGASEKAGEQMPPLDDATARMVPTTDHYRFMVDLYYMQGKFDSAYIYSKKNSNLVQNLQYKQTLGPKFDKFMQTMSRGDLNSVILLLKSGHKEEALGIAIGLIEKACYYIILGDIDQSEKIFNEIFIVLNEYKEYDETQGLVEVWSNTILKDLYRKLQIQAKKFETVVPQFKKDVEDSDGSLNKNFTYFSESERKEFFKEYTEKLNPYFSALLLYSELDKSQYEEILNKTIQTKGLIMEATKAQNDLIKKINDPETSHNITKIKNYREKLYAFSQIAKTSWDPSIEDSIQSYTNEIANLQKKVNEKLGTRANLNSQVNWKQIQAKLMDNEAYVEIVKIQRDNFNFDAPLIQYWAFIVRQNSDVQSILLGEGEEFEKGLRAYQNLIRFEQEDTKSYDIYWKQIAERTQGKTRIYFCADGVYNLINPITLKNPVTQKYLLEITELVRLSTGRDFLDVPKHASLNDNSVFIGNPNFTMSRKRENVRIKERSLDLGMVNKGGIRSGVTVLPGTEKEVTMISGFAKSAGANVSILKGNDATEQNVKKLISPSILHIATHGEFNDYGTVDSYLRSKLVLAGVDDQEPFGIDDYTFYEDGYLTAYEVTQMDLTNTKLVVLSACETGLGEVQGGEGVWGLQRAFQMAGAQTVLGSLWKVNDDATAVFMKYFYEQYYKGTKVNEAYQFAMTETKRVYPHPFNWGAFVLNGN